MDENKEKETLSTEDELLKQELEELARTFQQELDKAKEQEALSDDEQGGELIQELEELDEIGTQEDEEIPEDMLCECCGEKRKGTKKNPDSSYCYDCERALRHYPFELINIIIPVLAILFCFYASYTFSTHSAIYTSSMEAEKYAAQGKLDSALVQYNATAEKMTQKKINGEMIYKRYVDTAYKTGIFADSIISGEVFKSWELKLPHLKSVQTSYLDSLEMNATQAAISEIFYKYDAKDVKDIPYDKIIEEIEALNDQPAKAKPLIDGETEEEIPTTAIYNLEIKHYNRPMILYFEFYVSVICEKDYKTQISYLEKLRDEYPEMTWIYGAMLGDLYNKTGKDITEIYDKMKALNSEDSSADVLKATSLRINGKYDEAIKLCNKFIEKEDTYSYEFLRQKAICYLLEDDFDAAYKFAYAAYEQSAIPLTANLLMVCCIATDNTEVYNEVEELFKSSELEIAKEILDFKDGKTTAKEIFTKGDFDIA